MALQLDKNVIVTVDREQTFQNLRSASLLKAARQGAFLSSRQTQQSFGEFGQVVKHGPRLAAGLGMLGAGTEFTAGNQPAEVLITLPGLAKQRVSAIIARHLGANMSLDALFLRCTVKTHRAVDAIDIGKRHGGPHTLLFHQSGPTSHVAFRD